MAYADATSLELYLGRDLTDAEALQATAVCDAATEQIEGYTGKTWQGTTITGEQHTVYGVTITLSRTPVASISSITLRYPSVGMTPVTLVAGTDYEILNAQTGQVLLASYNLDPIINASHYRQGSILTVNYTITVVVPASIALAANMLAAYLLLPTGGDENQQLGIKSYSVGQELSVTYFDRNASSGSLPDGVKALLAPYRPRVVFA